MGSPETPTGSPPRLTPWLASSTSGIPDRATALSARLIPHNPISKGVGLPGSSQLGSSIPWLLPINFSIQSTAVLIAPETQGGTAWSILIPGSVGGLAGATADSIAGAGLQAQYRCPVCGRTVEKPLHCDSPADHTRGFRSLGNDGVNLAASIVGAAVAWGVFRLIVGH